jgi:hypothetical protein
MAGGRQREYGIWREVQQGEVLKHHQEVTFHIA